jgi:hypothetical protein
MISIALNVDFGLFTKARSTTNYGVTIRDGSKEESSKEEEVNYF